MTSYDDNAVMGGAQWNSWQIHLCIHVYAEVYYLHEVCHSCTCTNLVHGIVPEVYYLHELCHSCTNLVHGIVPEVYYLHELCHSCTNLVHGIVPEVYYLHEVCHSCTNLVHGTVLQEQRIWPIRDVLFHKLKSKVSKRSSAVWETYPACERTVSRACT